MTTEPIREDDLRLEVDGPGAPTPRQLLELSVAYQKMLSVVARENKTPLTMTGTSFSSDDGASMSVDYDMSGVYWTNDMQEIVCGGCGSRTPTKNIGGDGLKLLRALLLWVDAHESRCITTKKVKS